MKDAVLLSAHYTIYWVALKKYLKQLKREEVLTINGQPFVIRPASQDDIERISTGRVIGE